MNSYAVGILGAVTLDGGTITAIGNGGSAISSWGAGIHLGNTPITLNNGTIIATGNGGSIGEGRGLYLYTFQRALSLKMVVASQLSEMAEIVVLPALGMVFL